MNRASRWMWAGLCLVLVGCETDDTQQARTLGDTPPLALENALLYFSDEPDGTHRALLLDVAQTPATLSVRRLPSGDISAYPRPGHDGEVLVLSHGEPAQVVNGRGRDAVDSFVVRLDRRGERQRFRLTGGFAQLASSDDGRFVVAHAPSGNWSTADSVAVLDLEQAEPGRQVPAITVRALDGSGPSRVEFSPASAKRRLAVLVMSDAVNLIDLQQPDRGDKVLPLKLPDGSAQLRANKVLFHGDRIYVQPSQGNDVLVIRLDDDESSAAGFRASLSTLTTDNAVRDIALLEDEQGVRLVALGADKLRVIDTVTGDGESSALPRNTFTQLHVFTGSSPFDGAMQPRALLYGTGASSVGFMDLSRSLPGNERALDQLTLGFGLQSLAFPEQVAVGVATGSTGTLSVVDLQERTVSAVRTGATQQQQTLIDERDGMSRAWVATPGGQIGVIDLNGRGPAELLLDHPARQVLPLFGDESLVAITHDAQSGRVTLIDGRRPERSTAREVAGFLLSSFLD